MNENLNINSNNENLANSNVGGRITQAMHTGRKMKTYTNLYSYFCSMGNLTLAWRKARKGKTTKKDVIEFEKNIESNLLKLHIELSNKTYKPLPLKTFILRDPKTRIIAKSDFRDRIVHHALINILKPIFERKFIYDSCANQLNKGTTFALRRFKTFIRKVSDPIYESGFCLKADVKHYFPQIDHEILLEIISKNISDKNMLWLIKQILANSNFKAGGGGRTQKRNASRKLYISILSKCLFE